jgi:hypothetical protein
MQVSRFVTTGARSKAKKRGSDPSSVTIAASRHHPSQC